MTASVSALFIYPLKSGRRSALKDMQLAAQGPANDRLWMVARDEKETRGKMITQRLRGAEKLALVTTTFLQDGSTCFTAPEMPPLTIAPDKIWKSKILVDVWRKKSEAHYGGNVAAQWISSYLDMPAMLVRQAADHTRRSEAGTPVTLADGFPLLIASTSSLKALQETLPDGVKLTMEQFRPNIVLSGLPPFEEDVIHEIKIGDVVLELVKPCARCQMATYNQDRAAPSGLTLPMIKTQRGDEDGEVYFGQNAVVKVPGVIREGDRVEVLSRKALSAVLANCTLKPSV